MDKLSLFNEAQYGSWEGQLKGLERDSLISTFSLTKQDLLREQEVCELLNVSMRSMQRYRRENYLRFIKIRGQIYYHRFYLLMDLLKFNKRHKKHVKNNLNRREA